MDRAEMEIFVKHPVVVSFIDNIIEGDYPPAEAPPWVNYPAFKEWMRDGLAPDLYTDLMHGETAWKATDLLTAYNSDNLDLGDITLEVDDVEIPEEVIDLYDNLPEMMKMVTISYPPSRKDVLTPYGRFHKGGKDVHRKIFEMLRSKPKQRHRYKGEEDEEDEDEDEEDEEEE